MEHLMPQKKTIAIGIIALAIVSSVGIFVFISKNKSDTPTSGDIIALNDTEKQQYLSNEWQKVLVSLQSVSTSTSASTEPLDQSHTAQLARDIFAQYLLLQQNDVAINEEVAKRVAENSIANTQTKAEPSQYTQKNLNIDVSEGKQSISAYNNALVGVFKKRTLQNVDEPLTILYTSLENKDESLLKKLDPVIKSTDVLITDLLAVPVPQNMTALHLELINNYQNVLWALRAIANTYTDPVVSLSAVSVYQTYLDAVSVSLEKINTYLQKNS